MKQWYFLFIISLIFNEINGQNKINLGLTYQPSLLKSNRVRFFDKYYSDKFQFNNNFGIQLNKAVTKNFFFRTELQYIKRKLTASCLYIPSKDEPVTHIYVHVVEDNCNHSAIGNYSFIRLPISLGHYIKTKNPNFRIYYGVGISPLMRLNSKYQITSIDSNDIFTEIEGKFGVDSWLSLESYIGLSYQFSEGVNFSIEPTYFTDDLRDFVDNSFGLKLSLSRNFN